MCSNSSLLWLASYLNLTHRTREGPGESAAIKLSPCTVKKFVQHFSLSRACAMFRRGARFVALFPLFAAFNTHGQTNFAVKWSSVDGGGCLSTGGVFSVRATVGQPDARALMTGGNYRVGGGFWGLVYAVLTPGAPAIAISKSGTNTVISWPSVVTSWKLQESVTLSPAQWSNVLTAPVDDGTKFRVTVPMPGGNRFYRLTTN